MPDMGTIKTGPSIFTAMEAAVKPLATSLKVIEHNTASLSAEQQFENKISDKKAEKIDKEQSSLLQAINKNIIKSMSENGLWKWFSNNWGKILLGAGILLLPLEWWHKLYSGFKTFWDMPWWGKLATALTTIAAWKIGGAALSEVGRRAISGKKPTQIINTPQGSPKASPTSARQRSFDFDKKPKAPKTDFKTGLKNLVGKRLLPILGVGGRLLSWYAVAEGVRAVNEEMIKKEENNFFTGIGSAASLWLERITAGLVKKDNVDKTIKDFMTDLSKSIISLSRSISRQATKVKHAMTADFNLSMQSLKDTYDKIAKKSGEIVEAIKSTTMKDAIKSGKIGGGSTLRDKTTHPGGKDDVYVPPSNPEAERILKNQAATAGDTGERSFWDKTKSFFRGKPKPAAQPVAHIRGAVTRLHNVVGVHDANMSGVKWGKLGGRKFIEGSILNTWNDLNIPKNLKPTFTSGLRDWPAGSKHTIGQAFDLRSKDLGRWGPSIWASLYGTEKNPGAFRRAGFWGQWEKGTVNEKGRTGEHFHFQKAAKGFHGTVTKATGFIAGEAGPERVDIAPLVHPDTRMNAMNALNAENQTARSGQSGSSPVVITTDVQNVSNSGGTAVYAMNNSAHNQKPLVTSKL